MKAISRTFHKALAINRLNLYTTRTITTSINRETEENSLKSKHWSFSPSYPSETFKINSSDQLNDNIFENVMNSKFDRNKEKLRLCHKSNKLNNIFDNVSISNLDNILQNKILSQVMKEDSKSINSWMLYNYEKHENKKSWMLQNNQSYDANGIIICGLNNIDNKVYKIGPIILNKHYL
eukprot:244338_1